MASAKACSVWFSLALVSVSAFGCAANVKTALGPQNSHVITCGTGMNACVAKADKICGEDGYTILGGVSRTKLLGGASSSYRARSEIGELTVRCGLPGSEELEEEEESEVVYKLPPRTDEPVAVEEPIPAQATGAVCTPGATLACVVPGACQGGQVCLETGRGYGPCDCGGGATNGASPAAPAEGGPSTAPPKGGAEDQAPQVPGAAPAPTPLAK